MRKASYLRQSVLAADDYETNRQLNKLAAAQMQRQLRSRVSRESPREGHVRTREPAALWKRS